MKIKLLSKMYTEDNNQYYPIPNCPSYEYNTSTAATGYDWLVVYDEMPKYDSGTLKNRAETIQCPREQTLFIAQEPVSVKNYGRAFVHQFGHYMSTREPEAENHPNYHLGRGYYETYYGKKLSDIGPINIAAKTNIISTVCSSKQMKHTCHNKRFTLIKHLSQTIPAFDWYGKGVKPINFKYEALDTYKYHVAIENHIAKGHCTEKLIDSILGECLTFYAGDPDVVNWLPPESFVYIPLDNPAQAEKIIQEAIANNLFEKHLGAIREAKRLILTKYNFWSQIVELIESVKTQNVHPSSRPVLIKSRHRLRRNPLVALSDGYYHLLQIIKNLMPASK